MQFERLKKSHKKEILIALITICVIGVVFTFATSRAFYRVDDSIDLAKGTINYKVYDFKIMAMYKSEDGTNYTEITDRMPSSGYVINESKSYCTLDNNIKDISAELYTNSKGEHIIKNLAKNDKCFIYFDIKLTAARTIISSFGTAGGDTSRLKSGTPKFNQVALGAENVANNGIYMMSDGMYGGTSYYWRGAATTNYVKFANSCWRIIRINGDESIRLIYDGESCHANGTSTTDSIAMTSITYNTLYNNSSYVGWTYSVGKQRTLSGTDSNAKVKTEEWYNNTNSNELYASKVADGKFCNDRNSITSTGDSYSWSATGSMFYYGAYDRMINKYQPTLDCNSGDVYTLKVGAITADEIMLAGGRNQENKQYYLYNGQRYWTMSPYHWSNSDTRARQFHMNLNGNLDYNNVHYTNSGIRPVVNLKSDVAFSGGDGTLNNPYMVAD